MTLTALISDIHGNLPALDAVLTDARERGAERYWCLGDVVGYGAQPAECLDIVRELNASMIRGNHEEAVLRGPLGFNPLASQAIRWTRDMLEDHRDSLDYINSLGVRIDHSEAVLVHGSPAQPIDEYLFREDTLDHLPRDRDFSPKLARCFQLIDRPCFVGHTHVPGVIDEGLTWVEPADVANVYDTHSRPCIINVGSTGQPRDGDLRASYALFDGRSVTFRRVDYDVHAAAALIFAADGLPDRLGQRLLEGW
ncbi:MAG: phosphoesterase [Planctomycetota bacterium]|nr:MAG: phosphoesterase [Planctomycetota bacterium]